MKPIIEQVCTNIRTEQEGELLRIVQSYGFNIDRTRLMVALTDARRFYNEGYEDGLHSSRWISVEERLPEDGKNVLVHVTNPAGWWNVDVDWRTEGGWAVNADSDWHIVTHWMPLPEPPKEVCP